jgi:ATP adenylyltransferase
MDRLYTPWRYAFISAPKTDECVFCAKLSMNDEEALIVYRGKHCYICLNTYPYNNGHVMVIPFAHVDSLAKVPHEAATEMMALAQLTETVLRREYSPDGINMGMNLGKAAGAGVADHVHLHALPRWTGDANFMTVVGETRVLPEDLKQTWDRLHSAFRLSS